MRKGDRVRWINKHGEWLGVITCVSIGWKPERYFIEFDNGQRCWVDKSNFLKPDVEFVFR